MWGRFIVGLALVTAAGCGGDDAIPGVDSGIARVDGGSADAGRADAGAADAGAFDSGRADAATTDAGSTDAGSSDAGARDAGRDAGVGPAVDGGACTDPAPTADRPVATACVACRPVTPEPGGGSGACATHADCTAGTNGRCVLGMIGAFCSYDECFTDSDCGSGRVCSCDGAYFSHANTCVSGNCRVNSDCTGGRCSPSYGCLEGGGPEGWFCRTATDTCVADSDCAGGLGGRCAFDSVAGRWGCEFGICIP